MAFTVRQLNHRPWPVTVILLESNAAGEITEVKNTFVANFRPFTESEFARCCKAAEAVGLPDGATADAPADAAPPTVVKDVSLALMLRRNAALFSSLITGWGSEVCDEQGQPIPFSEEALSALVTGPDGIAVSKGINEALNHLRFGIAPAKNVEASPVPGHKTESAEAVQTN